MNGKLELDIIKRLVKGNDEDAYNEVYDYYKDKLYFFACSLVKNTTEAEEVVQETFLAVFEKAHTLEKFESFQSWLYKLCYNKATDLLRKRREQIYLDDNLLEQMVADDDDDEMTKVRKKEIYSIIREELDKMPENFTVVAELHYFEQFTVKEISDILDIPNGTIKTRLRMIKSLLRPVLKHEGFSPSSLFGIGLTPLMFNYYKSFFMAQVPQSSPAATSLQAVTTGVIAKKFLVASIGGVAVLGATTGIILQKQESEPIPIELSYNDGLTNQDVEVKLHSSSNEEITVMNGGTVIPLQKDGDDIKFLAKENGDYLINYEGGSYKLPITNIDKTIPEVISYQYENQVLTFDFEDSGSGIDYEHSYLKIGNSVMAVANTVQYDLQDGDDVELFIKDLAGNAKSYTFTYSRKKVN